MLIKDSRTTQAKRRVPSWREAIMLATAPLVELGYAKEEYGQSIIDNTLEYGPYYLIAPGIALPHARPEQGALSNGVAFTTLEEPVPFGNEECDPVWLLISICATDAQLHIKTIQRIAMLIEQSETLERIKSAQDDRSLCRLLQALAL